MAGPLSGNATVARAGGGIARLFRGRGSSGARAAAQTIVCAVPRGGSYAVHEVTLRGGSVAGVAAITGAATSERRNGKKKAPATANVDVVLALPRRDVIVKYIRVPTKNAAEIARMAPYEASLHSPWPVAESVVGYETQFGDDEGYTTTALYIARLGVVDEHIERLRALGLAVTRVEPSTRCYCELVRTGPDSERPAFLAVSGDGAEFVRLSGGHHEFSRGADSDEGPEEMLARCLDLDAKRLGGRDTCTSLVVAGPDAIGGGIGLPAESVFRIQDVRFGAVRESAPLDAGSTLAVGAALVAANGDSTSDLLPETRQRSLQVRNLILHARRLAALLAWLVLVAGAIGYLLYSVELRRAVQAEKEIEALRPEAGDLKAQSNALTLLARDRRDAALPLQLVLDLYDRAPQDIAISSFRYDSRGGVTLGGETQQFTSIYKLLDALKQSTLLREIRLTNNAKPRSGQNAVVEFKITARVVGND